MKTSSQKLFFVLLTCLLAGCGIMKVKYGFNDSGVIPPEVKTVKINYFENHATYINPQLAQKFTDKVQQKIIGSTRLTRTNSDSAHYIISGDIRTYDATQTVGVSAQQAAINRLTVTIHITLNKTLTSETKEFDVSRSFDYSANLSLQQAEGQLLDEVIRTLTDDIFNRIFSDW